MKFLIFDTETTGLPIRSDDYDALKAQSGSVPVQYNPNGSPRLAQLSWQLVDEKDTLLSRGDRYILPDFWQMPEETSKFNHITQEMLKG